MLGELRLPHLIHKIDVHDGVAAGRDESGQPSPRA